MSSENAPHADGAYDGLGDRGLRPEQPEPFVRGAAWPGISTAMYPRLQPGDHTRAPGDTWRCAKLPVGARLEVVGDATELEITYRTATDNLGYRGDGAGIAFTSWTTGPDGGRELGRDLAKLGDGVARVPLDPTAERTVVHLPEGMQPVVTAITGVGGEITPAPRQPLWRVYGDSVAEGWIASQPALAWPAIAGRIAGVDHTNLAFAGAARGETAVAEMIGRLRADVLTVAHGTNCWTRTPHTAAQMAANTDAFLAVLRQDHPETPIVVLTPVPRPDAETTPNRFGATLADLRDAMAEVTQARIDAGDASLVLLDGFTSIDAADLGDGIHPDDTGHRKIGALVAAAVVDALST